MNNLSQLRHDMECWMTEAYPEAIAVHGDGNPGASVMLVGEAPGEQETIERRPFVGKAGKNLNAFLQMAEIERADLYVTNVVKMRPWKLSAAGNRVNRPPTRAEIRDYSSWLFQEIKIVQPKVIVTLGNVPLNALADKAQTIGSVHGQLMQTEAGLLYPMYHPASVIYNRSLEIVYCEDVRKLGQLLRGNTLISD